MANRDVLDRLVLELLDKETLDKAEVAAIFSDLRKRPERPKWTGSAERLPAAGPIAIPAKSNGSNGSNGHHPVPPSPEATVPVTDSSSASE